MAFLQEWLRAHFFRSWVPKRNVAASYALGDGVRKDGARARVWYARAAAAGDEAALFDIGMMLLEGEGGAVDECRGQALVLKAASLGNGDAQKVLACAFAEGRWGFCVDTERAEHWRQLALAQGQQV